MVVAPSKRPSGQTPGGSAKKRKNDGDTTKGTFESKLALLNDELPFSSHIQSSRQANAEEKWPRPPVPNILINSTKNSIPFQLVDLDYFVENFFVVIRLFGVTKDGNSICAIIRDYQPYFYANAPPGFRYEHIEKAINALNENLKSILSNVGDSKKLVTGIDLVKGSNLYGYSESKNSQFLKIYVAYPKLVAPCTLNVLSDIVDNQNRADIRPFESNLDFEIRFMADYDIVGFGWLELPENKYTIVTSTRKATLSQLELEISVNDLIVHSPLESEWSDIAPLRTLSFDIECLGRKGLFPEALYDPVIQISNMVKIEGKSEPFIRNCFVLNSCAPVVGSDIIECKTEQELLQRWSEFIQIVDPDLITGYNIQNFDFPYIIDRAKHLKIDQKVSHLSRVKGNQCKIRDATLQSKQLGNRVNKLISIEGRIIFDVLQLVLRDYKLRSYTLNSVSYHFLDEQKEDVEPNFIPELQNGTAKDRRRLAIYCMKDAYLPLRLLDKLMLVVNYIEMARVTGVPLNFLIFRGQQVKILSQLLRKTKQQNLFLPVIEGGEGDSESYEGATVIEPSRGYYQQPIATLDFASLYPSIMIAHNLCYTTLLNKQQLQNLKEGEDYIKTPAGDCFVKASRQKGLLPQILEDILSARQKAKFELKNETNPFKKMVLNGRQLALKISANSVYGFTGATRGKLPCLQISQSVTSFGRQMIDLTKNAVESFYKKDAVDGKCPQDAKVIYGDTDSVMVNFGVKTVVEAMELGQHAANQVSQQFVKPIKLEFEKVYFPYLLINKKRYAGLYYTKPDKHDKMDCKGLETVRRDNCPLVASVLNVCLEKLMVDRDKNGAVEYTKKIISDLLCNRIDISMLIITKELTRKNDKYQARQAHVELAERMRKRDPGSAPRLGDRVPYVIISKGKNVPAYEKAEDPIYVLQNRIPIDTDYYLHHQLKLPLVRLFDSVLDNKAESILFSGEHTRQKMVAQCKVGGLVGFTKKLPTCLGCKAVLRNVKETNPPPTCDHCKTQIGKIYTERVLQLQNCEHRYARLWSECQSCAGSLQDEILCSARDCPIFYMREKVRTDVEECTEVIRRFDSADDNI